MFKLTFSKLSTFVAALAFCVNAWAGSVNINTADAQALADNIVGVGPKIAAKIVEEREKNGPFASIEELLRVKGIGPKTLEKNRDSLLLETSSKDS